MLDAVKRYATRVLVVHGALFLLVIFLVLGAARQVQLSAREEAQNQTRVREQILADETATGIEARYRSVLSVLDVVLHDDSAAATMPASAPAEAPPAGAEAPLPGGRFGFGGRGGRGGQYYPGGRGGAGGRLLRQFNLNGPVNVSDQTLNTLGRQLTGSHGPVSQIFLVDATRGQVYNPQDRGAYVYPQESLAPVAELLKDPATLSWIENVTGAEMSDYKNGGTNLPGASGGYHLIALPAQVGGIQGGFPGGGFSGGGFGAGGFGGFGPGGRGLIPGNANGGAGGPGFGNQGGPESAAENAGSAGGGRGPTTAQAAKPQFVMVVVVPMSNAAEDYLSLLNPAGSAGGTERGATVQLPPLLVNEEEGQVLFSNPLIGAGSKLLPAISDSAVRSELSGMIAPRTPDAPEAKVVDSAIIDHAFGINGTQVAPQIVASAQFGVPSGKRWTVLIFSPLSEADVVVNRVFRSAAWWALFVSLSVTGILVSTSAFLITARVRLERTRHEVLTRELEQARHIQLAWLPDMKTVPAGIEISAVNLPASHISGDFYNWFLLPGRADARGGAAAGTEEVDHSRIAIVIGDVTGHGMAAAFLMATTQLLVRMTLLRYQDVGRCLREVNRQLCAQATGGAGGFQGQFVTMLVMVLDTRSNTLEIASAGHPTPLIETGGTLGDGLGRFTSVEIEPQLVLGVNLEEDYHAQTLALEPGASVVLYTDGVVEAERADGRQYGVQNLIQLLEHQNRLEKNGVEPAQRTRAILEDVKKFCGGHELLDDLTLVALRASAVPAEAAAAGREGH